MKNGVIPFWQSEFSKKQCRQIAKSTSKIILKGPYIGGELVKLFEQDFAKHVCVGYPVAVANGLQALEIALHTFSLNEGKRIGVPAHTFIATWLAVLNVRSIPIAIDVDTRGQMDLDKFSAVANTLDAVIPVHMHGAGVNMNELMQISRENNLKVIEDSSQSHGLSLGNQRVGEFGDAAAFSLYPTKNIGALGDAGIIVFRSEEHALKARQIANYGAVQNNKYIHNILGTNSRLDPIQTPALQISLNNLEESIKNKRMIAGKYLQSLQDNPTLSPLIHDVTESTWHHFVIRVSNRQKFINEAHNNGIFTDIHYPRSAAEEISEITGQISVNIEIAKKLSNEIVSLPIYSKLKKIEIEKICNFINSYRA
jgi:dTDP-4-amino-4,6-dideoxygalactose transaminase